MARPKEFDRDAALAKAVEVFWDKGYEAASTEDLVRAMGIGRQSMYDTFGDKHALFMAALEKYRREEGTSLNQCLSDAKSPLEAIESVLVGISAERLAERTRGCLLIAAIAELGPTDGDVSKVASESAKLCEDLFARAIRQAQKKGEIGPNVDSEAAARFLFSTICGLRLRARAGATPESLRDTARFAMAAIKQ